MERLDFVVSVRSGLCWREPSNSFCVRATWCAFYGHCRFTREGLRIHHCRVRFSECPQIDIIELEIIEFKYFTIILNITGLIPF